MQVRRESNDEQRADLATSDSTTVRTLLDRVFIRDAAIAHEVTERTGVTFA
jgi:hypothetical protein